MGSMNSVRAYASAAQLKTGQLLVTGGYNIYGKAAINSAEMLTEQGWTTKVPPLPVTIAYHCMVTVNSTTVMVIAGLQDEKFSGKTFYFNTESQTWTEGPELSQR
jgi:hypothetical protein